MSGDLAGDIVAYVGQCVGQTDPHAGVREMIDQALTQARQQALEEVTLRWQTGAWTILTPLVKTRNPIALGQSVADWLREQAKEAGEPTS